MFISFCRPDKPVIIKFTERRTWKWKEKLNKFFNPVRKNTRWKQISYQYIFRCKQSDTFCNLIIEKRNLCWLFVVIFPIAFMDSISASFDTVESEGRQMKQYWKKYIKKSKQKSPLFHILLFRVEPTSFKRDRPAWLNGFSHDLARSWLNGSPNCMFACIAQAEFLKSVHWSSFCSGGRHKFCKSSKN